MPKFVGFVVSEVIGELQQESECCSSKCFVTLQVPPTVSRDTVLGSLAGTECAMMLFYSA